MRSSVERLLSAALAAAALLAFGGCGEESADGETDESADDATPDVDAEYASLDERPCPDDSYLSFESFGGPFLISWCGGCHTSGVPEAERQGAPLGVDFDDIDAVRTWSARIWARSGDHNVTMPPVGGPEAEDRAMLGEWLACGAPALADMED
jgi:hypothetical protein